jgi:hypothetical protein
MASNYWNYSANEEKLHKKCRSDKKDNLKIYVDTTELIIVRQ